MAYSTRITRHTPVVGKHLKVRALDTPGTVRLTRFVPGVSGGEKRSVRKKEISLDLDDARTLKALAYGRIRFVEPDDKVVIIQADRTSVEVSGRAFEMSMRSIGASGLGSGGFGGSGGRVVLPGPWHRPPGKPLKCSKSGCRYRVVVYYYDPNHPPRCAVHPDRKMIPA